MGNIYVSDSAAGKSISAYVILDRKGKHVATVRAHFGNSRVLVNVHDDKAGFQHASASGYGYDKFAAALSGLSIDGHAMTDHCGERIKPPKGKPCFPANYKPRKGYTLANWATYDAVTGQRIDSYSWWDKALATWRAANGQDESAFPAGDDWEAVQRDVRRLVREASESGATVDGYSDCFREAGLKYLSAIGYRVIQAI